MSNHELNNLDDFRRFVSSMIKPWSPEQRTALAAGMAERWLPVYESFSEQEEWGDPAVFQRAVQAVWDCVVGHTLTPKELRLHKKRVQDNTPHLDDFDAEEVIATSGIIYYALNCCLNSDNTDDAVMAMVSAFEGVAPGIYTDAGEDVWRLPQVKDHIMSELKSSMDTMPPIDEQEIDALRQHFMPLPAVTDEGVGPLPPEVWHAPEVSEQLEKTLKLLKAISNMDPIDAQQIEAFRKEAESPGTDTEAEQAALNVWQLPQVQEELDKQLKLINLISDMVQIDQHQIDALRQKLTSRELVGTVAPRPERPRGLTNEAIFVQYRSLLELSSNTGWQWDQMLHSMGDNFLAILATSKGEWGSRYSRRKDAIEQMIDAAAHDALLARYSTHDAAVQGDPGWDQETRSWIEQFYENASMWFEVDSPDKPHSYGPSLQRLCIERTLAGDSGNVLWKSIFDWGRHRPSAWEEEDGRKKKGLAYASPELGELLTRKLSWRATTDVDHPWATEDAGETWRVRINDFPDDLMYTLIINDAAIGSFHDWPKAWQR